MFSPLPAALRVRLKAMSLSTWIRGYVREAPVTTAIFVICTVVAALTAIQAMSLSSWANTGLGETMILWGPLTVANPSGSLRAVTAGFLHLDAGHVAINMFFLLLIGREVEKFAGSRLYAGLYFAGILGASAAVLLFDPHVPTAGASGALYALMAVLVGVIASQGGDLRAPLVLVGVNVVYSFLAPGVSLFGHLGGLVAGVLMAWPITRSPAVQWIGVLVVGALGIAVLGWRMVDLAIHGISVIS